MLPFLRDRPLVLQEPGTGRFLRQAPADTPAFVRAVGVTSPDTNKTVDYVLAEDARSLRWLAERGHVEFHVWHSRARSLGCPDYAFFDLDPSPGSTFEQVCEVAMLVKEAMSRLGLRSYAKTSGLTGLQVYVPTDPVFGFGQVREWTRKVCARINRDHPTLTTMEWRVDEREGVFLDHLMMAPNKNAICALSPRLGEPAPTISMPVTWDEVEARSFRPAQLTIELPADRLARAGRAFQPVVESGQRLPIQGASRELPHTVGPDWRHAGPRRRIRCIVGGWSPPEGETGAHMGSAVLGLYYKGELAFVGKAPVPREARHELYVRVAELRADEPPFINAPAGIRGAHWARPELVCRLECSGLTGGPSLRAPSYLGLEPRSDPRSCTLEQLGA